MTIIHFRSLEKIEKEIQRNKEQKEEISEIKKRPTYNRKDQHSQELVIYEEK